jgi:hypothetical protein
VGPSVRSNLVTFSNHAFNQVRIWCCEIDFSLAVVVTGNEKGGLEIVLLEQVEEL